MLSDTTRYRLSVALSGWLAIPSLFFYFVSLAEEAPEDAVDMKNALLGFLVYPAFLILCFAAIYTRRPMLLKVSRIACRMGLLACAVAVTISMAGMLLYSHDDVLYAAVIVGLLSGFLIIINIAGLREAETYGRKKGVRNRSRWKQR